MVSWALLDNLYEILPSPLVGSAAVVAAGICGVVIGWDRERLRKPAGLTTMALICVGSAVYTQASLLLGVAATDPARIAAQIVTGIGFLGAGAILREGREVTGLTTAATIWAVAAIGIVLGAGYLAAGVALTGLILAILTGVKRAESRLLGPCHHRHIDLTFTTDGGRTEMALREIMDRYFLPTESFQFHADESTAHLRVRYCDSHRHHRQVAPALSVHPAVHAVTAVSANPK